MSGTLTAGGDFEPTTLTEHYPERMDAIWQSLGSALGRDAVYAQVAPVLPSAERSVPGVLRPASEFAETDRIRTGYLLGNVAVEAAGVVLAKTLPGEQKVRERYEQFRRGVDMYLGNRRNEAPVPEPDHRSTLDLLREAGHDSVRFMELFGQNKTHLAEILRAYGVKSEVTIPIGPDGLPIWNGQTNEERQFHMLTAYDNQPAPALAATDAEGLTTFQIDYLSQTEQYGQKIFEFSPVLADLNSSQYRGYFMHSVSACIRMNTLDPESWRISTIFVSGVDERRVPPRQPRETEEEARARMQAALDNRFDIAVFNRIRKLLLGDAATDNADPVTILEEALAADREFDDVDITMLYDVLAAEEIQKEMPDGAKTFFGSVKLWQEIGSPQILTREHYEKYLAERDRQLAEYDALCLDITHEQVRRAGEVTTPLEATELNKQIALEMAAERAVKDHTMDATRFGPVAAGYIAEARAHYERGDVVSGDIAKDKAKGSAKDPSCPPGQRDATDADGQDQNSKETSDCKEICNGDKVRCPYCKQRVRAVVLEKGGRVYCGNGSCTASLQQKPPQQKTNARKKIPQTSGK